MTTEKLEFGRHTVLSGRYLQHRLNASRIHALENYEELKLLFKKFERNIDKNKTRKLISTF